ncbi:DUF6093 family protein [Microbacterium sp. 77mftsu3.1]|uniref:DUF6093 family protein n=1 Tax=Microbacterium sp. 77mftsu3.1 TaxID=1761802 RepID=UPI00036D3A6B|nr:DUF6093 family protein [Microbacterium sp. 77mftsu3.1]SDG21670.1 hypothetical protein SAMN04488590_0212 [Microbacterium sp. 77mftsu3.1]
MSVESILARARARTAETRFTEDVVVGTFKLQTNPTTGKAERVPATVEYEGPAQIALATLAVSDRDVVAQDLADQSPVVKLPSGTVVSRDAEVLVNASRVDQSLVGTRYRVSGKPQAGQTSAARYPVQILS